MLNTLMPREIGMLLLIKQRLPLNGHIYQVHILVPISTYKCVW